MTAKQRAGLGLMGAAIVNSLLLQVPNTNVGLVIKFTVLLLYGIGMALFVE